MFVSVSARLEKMFHRTYEIDTDTEEEAEKIALKAVLKDLVPLKKQGFIITDVSTKDFSNWVEEIPCEDESISEN